jgi:hypothetical protein
MANLGMKRYELVGKFMRALCKDRNRCNEMAKNSELATKEFKNVLEDDMPPGHKIVVHLDEENVTHVIIPQKKDVEEIEASIKEAITGDNRVYPPEYRMNPLSQIIETTDPNRALSFLLGEYTLRRCKK